MSSDRDSDSSTFDALWDFDLEDGAEEQIPPALDPRGGKGGKVPPEQRDTLLPPVPAPEYVQTMMELGELDDPSMVDDTRPARPPTAPRPPARRAGRDSSVPEEPPQKLGLVLASESELLLPMDDDGGPGRPPAATSPGPAAIAARRSAEAASLGAPRRNPGDVARPPGNLSTAGLRAPTGPRAPAGLPVPRAPSIPPPAGDAYEALAGLTGLDSLEGFDKPASSRRGPLQQSYAPAPLTPGRAPSSDRTGRITGSAGLRLLGKSGPPPPENEGDRVTPLAIETAPSSVHDAIREMQLRFDARKYGDALVLAESVLNSNPQHAEARRLAESCREMLADKYLSSLGGRTCIPHVCMTPDEVRDLSLDHRAGFLLSFIDGSMSIEEVLDVSSMPELDALRMMFELRQQGAIDIEQPPQRSGRK